jgi:hypothetical protein
MWCGRRRKWWWWIGLGREIYKAVGLLEAVDYSLMQLRLRRCGCKNVACDIACGGSRSGVGRELLTGLVRYRDKTMP